METLLLLPFRLFAFSYDYYGYYKLRNFDNSYIRSIMQVKIILLILTFKILEEIIDGGGKAISFREAWDCI